MEEAMCGAREYMQNLCTCLFILLQVLVNIKLLEKRKSIKKKEGCEAQSDETVIGQSYCFLKGNFLPTHSSLACYSRLLSTTLAMLTSLGL